MGENRCLHSMTMANLRHSLHCLSLGPALEEQQINCFPVLGEDGHSGNIVLRPKCCPPIKCQDPGSPPNEW